MRDLIVGSGKWKQIIRDGAKTLGVSINNTMANQFAIHALELLKWNKKTNLTAITDPLDMAVKHYIDSMIPAKYLPENALALDIGSGGGFPGIVLKILKPSLKTTLIDASRKKISFLSYAIRMLDLDNIKALHTRAEDLSKEKKFEKHFDVIVSRALSSLKAFVIMGAPLLKKGGFIIAMKGKEADARAEIESLQRLSGKEAISHNVDFVDLDAVVTSYKLPFLDAERSIVRLSFD